MNRTTTTLGALTVVTLLAAPAMAAEGLWLHVTVDGREGESVRINLPLSLVEKALPMIPDEHFRDGELVLDHVHWGHGHRLSLADLRDLWNEVRTSPDMTFVTVEEGDESVRVSKQGGYLLVDTEERGDEAVQVRVPVTVVDALLASDGETLDVRAAIEALAEHGEGELVAVNDRDEQVRVWIDARAESD